MNYLFLICLFILFIFKHLSLIIFSIRMFLILIILSWFFCEFGMKKSRRPFYRILFLNLLHNIGNLVLDAHFRLDRQLWSNVIILSLIHRQSLILFLIIFIFTATSTNTLAACFLIRFVFCFCESNSFLRLFINFIFILIDLLALTNQFNLYILSITNRLHFDRWLRQFNALFSSTIACNSNYFCWRLFT